jgi:sortase B
MSEKQQKCRSLNKEFRKWRRINTWIDRVILSVLLALIVFTGAGLIDGFVFLEEGVKGVEYHNFSRLRKINPDVEAWITVDGTHIDHPVVRSEDNFDYLDKGFDGKFYAGGTLFMDMNDESFEDPYCMIHGHHMAAGAMFGDLDRFLDGDFFERNGSGVLLTPEYDYDIEVFAAGVYNAYDRNIYRAGRTFMYEYVKENSVNFREQGPHDHVLALSTCMDDMTDNRAVVFCDLVNRRKHR